MTIRILLSKVVEIRKTKIELGIPFSMQKENGKRKWNLEFPFSMGWVDEGRGWRSEFRFPTSQENSWH